MLSKRGGGGEESNVRKLQRWNNLQSKAVLQINYKSGGLGAQWVDDSATIDQKKSFMGYKCFFRCNTVLVEKNNPHTHFFAPCFPFLLLIIIYTLSNRKYASH